MKALIALACLLGLGAVVGAVVVGVRHFEGTVVDHPYERGIAWEGELARRRASGLEVQLARTRYTTGPETAPFTLSGPAAGSVRDGDVTVRARRPESAGHDRAWPARRQPDGTWVAPLHLPLAGRWELRVQVVRADGLLEFPAAVVAVAAGDGGEACDLDRGPCTQPFDGGAGAVTLEITPRPVRTMRKVEVTVGLSCPSAPCAPEAASVVFTMPGMYMGPNTVRLEPAGEGRWRGRGVLVQCPSGRRAWRATVKVPPLGEAAFEFEADRP